MSVCNGCVIIRKNVLSCKLYSRRMRNMDINQAARMIEWLDEERRRDKATIATLEERLAQQQDTVTMLSKRLNSMESDQTVIRTQIAPSGRETDLIEQVRKEVVQLIENV